MWIVRRGRKILSEHKTFEAARRAANRANLDNYNRRMATGRWGRAKTATFHQVL